jgi:hypothetical protein
MLLMLLLLQVLAGAMEVAEALVMVGEAALEVLG